MLYKFTFNKRERAIKVSEMAVTAQALEEYKSREGLLEKVTLQAATVDRQRWNGKL